MATLQTSSNEKSPFGDGFTTGFNSRRDRSLSSSLRRQKLLRSAGSFSFLEEIVVPTPRKYPSLSVTRKDRSDLDYWDCSHNDRSSETLLSEAGEELQHILYQSLSMETLPSFHKAQILNELECEARRWEEEVPRPASAIPLRSSNPIIMNSAFEEDEKAKIKTDKNSQPPKRVHPVDSGVIKHYKISRPAHSDNPRLRSASWPALSKLISSQT